MSITRGRELALEVDLDDLERSLVGMALTMRKARLLEIVGDTTRSPRFRRSAFRELARIERLRAKLRGGEAVASALGGDPGVSRSR